MTDLSASELPATRSTDAADDDLAARLSALEARAPGRDDPPALPNAGRWRRWGASMAAASVLVLVLAGTVGAGVLVVAGQQAHSAPGIENPGQPLYGANLECMSPPQAAAFLAAHGYADVVWQVEAGDPGLGKAGLTSVQQATPPEHGFVIPAAVLDDGRLHIVVDQRLGAVGVGTCHGMEMP
ncbi:MAG: hypothetical protein ACHQ3P_01195 [Candidatus Limnocylindrales bacterium]